MHGPILLDCHDLDAAVRSLAVAGGRPEAALIEAITSVDVDWTRVTEETETAIPRRAFALLDLVDDDFRFDGTAT
ncbi:hypothetical protein F4560_003239 [Saccharothrix ecbatanensis]|uniref:Uncharacterized protein n=1 Tax=Saccharothrix ecbatanensis TaxID=1105145 RepID=A0A7W9M128_9PSEU|nr:hypothetical protein [Saccharothrix ecbatanensis]MBB5803471.1 hypothetical protein [Saccharothrix ecbatanensis]